MKTNTLKLIVTLLIFIPFSGISQAKWDFPVKPGTEEWKKFQSNEEMVRACQIPEHVLATLSTEDLMDLCLRYPLLYDVFAFSNLNAGLDKLFSDFNGMRALYQRKDVVNNLIEQYANKINSLSFLEEEKHSDLEKGFFIVSISALEILFSRLNRQENHREVLQSLVAGYEEKLRYPEKFRGIGLRTNFYSRAHVISKMDKTSAEQLAQGERNSALFSGMVDEQTFEMINQLSYQLIRIEP